MEAANTHVPTHDDSRVLTCITKSQGDGAVELHRFRESVFPVVLFGSQYWQGLLAWLSSTMLNEKNINAEDLGLIYLTDSPKDAVDFIVKTCESPENKKVSGTQS